MTYVLGPLTLTPMRPFLCFVLAAVLAGCTSTPSGPVTEDGSLAVGDATLTTGEYQDSYDVTMSEGQWLRVSLDSDAFDPYLVVRFPNAEQSDLDDSTPGDTTSVTMVLRAQQAGTFNIIATSYRPGATGAYRLSYEVTDTEPAGDAPAAPAAGAADAPATGDEAGDGDSIGEIDGGPAPGAEAPKADEETLDA